MDALVDKIVNAHEHPNAIPNALAATTQNQQHLALALLIANVGRTANAHVTKNVILPARVVIDFP
jgi:hypothetical protein